MGAPVTRGASAIRRQAILAELSRRAAAAGGLQDVLDVTVELAAEGLGADVAGVLELQPEGDLLIRAGVGYPPGVVGALRVGGGRGSQCGYTLEVLEPVVLREVEDRFEQGPELMSLGFRSGVSVPVLTRGGPYGTVAAVAAPPDAFGAEDCVYLELVAAVLAAAIDNHRALQEVARGRRFFAAVVEHAPDVITRFDAQLRYVYASPAIRRYTGHEPSFYVGKTDFETDFDVDDAERWTRELRRVVERGEVRSYDFRFRCDDGVVRWFESRAAPERGPDGEIVGAVIVTRDTTAAKEAEAAIEESERRFRMAFDGAGVGMVLVDATSGILRANATLGTILGRDPSELVGVHLIELTHPDDVEESKRGLAALDSGAITSVTLEKRFLRPDGEVVWARVFASAVRDDEAGIRYNVAQVEDVTLLRRVERELDESQRLHRLVFEGARDLIVVLDSDGHAILVSGSVAEVLGYEPSALRGRPLAELLHTDDQTVLDAAAAQACECGFSDTIRLRARRADGHVLLLEGSLAAGLDAAGQPEHLVATLRDVTERERLEEQLRQAQKMEAIGRLAGGVAHDFNNLLTAINGYAELLLAGLVNEHERRQAAGILAAGERAAALTRQLLAFSRMQVLHPEPLDVDAVVESYLGLLERLLGEDIEIEVRLAAGLPPVLADAGQLGQVVLNLAVNARDAMPYGGRLTLGTDVVDIAPGELPGVAAGRYVVLRIADDGEGMDEEVRARIFEPFFTTKAQGHGTGLGLATVLGIVEQSGGEIVCRSAPGEGTEFQIYLPAGAGPAAVGAPAPPRAFQRRVGGTILLVEDDSRVRELTEAMLVDAGYEVVAAGLPSEALSLAAERPFDLVLTDIVMPEMDGRDLARRIRSKHPGTRTLLMSGYARDDGDRDLAQVLQKPFTRDELLDAVAEALEVAGR